MKTLPTKTAFESAIAATARANHTTRSISGTANPPRPRTIVTLISSLVANRASLVALALIGYDACLLAMLSMIVFGAIGGWK